MWYTWEKRVYKVLMERPEGKRPFVRQDIDGRIGSEWFLRRLAGGVWSEFCFLRMGIGGRVL
jgi:hypothetical protein